MKYQILMRLRKTGNFYYFSHWDKDDPRKARGSSPRLRSRALIYPSIRSACADVKKIDREKYRVVVVRYICDDRKERAFRLNFISEERAMEYMRVTQSQDPGASAAC